MVGKFHIVIRRGSIFFQFGSDSDSILNRVVTLQPDEKDFVHIIPVTTICCKS